MPNLEQAISGAFGYQTQARNRQNALADYCVAALEARGLQGVHGGSRGEVFVQGLVREKSWDVAYFYKGKPRLLISLKSIMKNIAGAVPNRLDELGGESSNVQAYFPEVVIGYLVVTNTAEDSRIMRSRQPALQVFEGTWIDYFEQRIAAIAVRQPPLWNQGLVDAAWMLRVNTEQEGTQVVQSKLATQLATPPKSMLTPETSASYQQEGFPSTPHETAGEMFFDLLVERLRSVEPAVP